MTRSQPTAAATGASCENGGPLVALPEDLRAELRRLLAAALVADYLADSPAVKSGNGNDSLGEINPSSETDDE